jgi:hypothetical protein
VIDAQKGWGIINHDLFLSRAVKQVIRRSVEDSSGFGA